MKALVHIVLYTASVLVAAYVIPGVVLSSYLTAFVLAIVLGILNMTLKPILLVLTFPITIVTLGLFALVINTLMVMLAAAIVPGFFVPSFLSALGFGIVLSVVNAFLHHLTNE